MCLIIPLCNRETNLRTASRKSYLVAFTNRKNCLFCLCQLSAFDKYHALKFCIRHLLSSGDDVSTKYFYFSIVNIRKMFLRELIKKKLLFNVNFCMKTIHPRRAVARRM